jgi:hypothetical protein
MLSALIMYLIFGAGFYVGAASKDPKGFIDASAADLMRGLLIGIPFWPVGLVVQVIFALKSYEK